MAKSDKKAPAKKAPAPKSIPVAAAPAIASAFKLEGGIPVPPRTRAGGLSPYPFAAMVVSPAEGSTFLVAAEVEPALYSNEAEAATALIEEKRKIANRLSGAVRRFTKLNAGYKFAVRTVDDGVRVWRTE